MKKLLAKILSISLIAVNSFVCVNAAGENSYFTDFSESAPANWTFQQTSAAKVANGVLEIEIGESDKWAVWKSSKPYPTGRVIVEYDFMSESDKASIYIQNPTGGSVCRLQQVAGNVLQLQHSNDAGTANENTAVLNRTFATGTWYHIKLVIDYRDDTSDASNRTTSSVYVYNSSNELIGSAEDKLYLDAKNRNTETGKYISPTYLQTIQMSNLGTEGSGSIYFDNFSVYEYVPEYVPEGDVYAFDFNDNVQPAGMTVKNTEGFNGVRNKRVELTKPEGVAITVNPEAQLAFNKMAHGAFGGQITAEFDYSSSSDKALFAYFQASPNGGSLVRIEQTGDAAARVVTGGADAEAANTNTAIDFAKDTVYHAKVMLDYENEMCSVYIDGTAVAENHHFMTSQSPGVLNVVLMQNSGTTGTVAIDNFVLYPTNDSGAVLATEAMLDIEGKSAVTENVNLPAAGYSEANISWTSADSSILSASGELVSIPTADTDVTLTALISKGTKHCEKAITVTVKGVPEYQSVAFSQPVITVDGSGAETASITVTKPRAQEVTFCFVAAVYNGSGELEDVNFGTCTAAVNKPSATCEIEIPETADKANRVIKYYVWDSVNSMIPLAQTMSE